MIGRTPDSARRANIWLPVGRPAAARPASQPARRLPRSRSSGKVTARDPSQLGTAPDHAARRVAADRAASSFKRRPLAVQVIIVITGIGRMAEPAGRAQTSATAGTSAAGATRPTNIWLSTDRPADRRSSKHPAAARRTRRSPVCPSPYGGGGTQMQYHQGPRRGPDVTTSKKAKLQTPAAGLG